MSPKTLQFDKALDEYFSGLALDEKGGQERICRFSGERFYVRPEDIQFYKKIRVPLPTLSPAERMRRRMAFASGYNLFRTKSALTGKSIVAVCPATTPFKIYEHQEWSSDRWNPLNYGRSINLSRPFFEQFRKLQLTVPRPNLNSDTSNINSDYTHNSTHLKNCYLTFDTLYGENLYYFECCIGNKDCVDCWSISQAEICYKCGDSKRLYKCFFCERSYDVLESYFLYDCQNCEHCFMCSNLRNKKYYFFNQPLAKEEYEKRLKEINLGNYEVLKEYLKKYQELKNKAVIRDIYSENSVNCLGDWVFNSKNCHYVLFVSGSENTAYAMGFLNYRDCYDVIGGTNAELCYEMTISTENNYNIKFSDFINNSCDLEYCELCRNCRNCFGCVGLANKSFCVFNKQYSESDYWKTVDEIKTRMLERGEYGEFFPPQLAPLPYNLSLNMAYPGYEDIENAKKYGYSFEEIKEESQETAGLEVIPASKLPLDIKDVDDSILEKVIADEINNKKFRLTKYELEFYRRYNLPLPRTHPLVRMSEWRKDFNMRFRFYDRTCSNCGKPIKTTYPPDSPKRNIYCRDCYLKKVV